MQQVECFRVTVKPGTEALVREWARHLNEHREEVRQLLVTEGMAIESVFLEDTQEGKTYYAELTGISKADASFPMIYFKVGSGLNEVKPDAATKKLEACCKFQKPATAVLRN